jgi:hypothetical protein
MVVTAAAETAVARANAAMAAVMEVMAAATVVVMVAAIARLVKTAAASFSLPVHTAHALHRVKAVVADPAWANQLALPTSPAHHAHLQVNLTPCAPVSI